MSFALLRTFDLTAFVADDDPNVTPPTDAEILKIGKPSRAHGLYFKAFEQEEVVRANLVEVPAATFDFTTWMHDPGSGLWIKLEPEEDVESSDFLASPAIGHVWVQLTGVDDQAGAAEYAELWMGALTTV